MTMQRRRTGRGEPLVLLHGVGLGQTGGAGGLGGDVGHDRAYSEPNTKSKNPTPYAAATRSDAGPGKTVSDVSDVSGNRRRARKNVSDLSDVSKLRAASGP